MAAITVGITEIEERIEAVRRRLNGGLALRAACAAASVLCTVLAIAVASGLHHRLEIYGLFYILAVAIAAGLAAVASLEVRRRWYDLPAAARVIDERAQLADRLTTLITMRQQRRPGRLMPVLIAQLIALMPRWQPFHVAPRRIPQIAYVCGISVLLLGLAIWFQPPQPRRDADAPPAPAAVPPQPQAQAAPNAENANVSPPGQVGEGEGQTAGRGGDQSSDISESKDEDGRAMLDRLVAPLQQAMTRAFYPQRQPAAKQAPRADHRVAAQPKPDSRQGTAETNKPEASELQPQPAADGAQLPQATPQSGAESGSSIGERRDPQRDSSGAPRPDPAAAGKAGDGTSPGGVLDPNATLPAVAHNSERGTFKLTLTSFLQASDSSGRKNKGARGKGGGTAAAGGDPMLSEYQQSDDALRKAEVPAEYEEIVRRVYSARGSE